MGSAEKVLRIKKLCERTDLLPDEIINRITNVITENGTKLDKLQEGDFVYNDRKNEGTLTEYAEQVRRDVNHYEK